MTTSKAATTTLTVEGPPPPPPAEVTKISPALRAAILERLNARVGPSRNRLTAVRSNFPPQLRARGFPALADNLERAVADVIGEEAEGGKPGALGRLIAEVSALLDAAEDV